MRLRSIAPRLGRMELAFAAAAVTTFVAALTGFLDLASLLVTVGGTAGVTLLTFSRARLDGARRHVVAALAPPASLDDAIATLKRFARIHRVDGAPALERAAASTDEPFLRHAMLLALEYEDADELTDALTGEMRVRAADGEAARQVLVTIGKLPPAFGLIGTLIGLVLLLRNMTGTDFASLGPGLALAVLTTLYGAVLSNVVVLPLATKLQAHVARRTLLMRMVVEGVLLVHAREYPTRIERALRPYLSGSPVEDLGDRSLPVDRAA